MKRITVLIVFLFCVAFGPKAKAASDVDCVISSCMMICFEDMEMSADELSDILDFLEDEICVNQ